MLQILRKTLKNDSFLKQEKNLKNATGTMTQDAV